MNKRQKPIKHWLNKILKSYDQSNVPFRFCRAEEELKMSVSWGFLEPFLYFKSLVVLNLAIFNTIIFQH